MGQGGTIVLINNTSKTWKRTHQHSYQMDSWNFPETVDSHSSVRVYVEWDENTFHNIKDDGGDVTYTLQDENNTSFSIHFHDATKREIKIDIPTASPFNINWKHDGEMNFGVSEKNGKYFFYGQDCSRWMTENPFVRSKTLKQLTLLGSHDAGMSELHAFAGPVTKGNVLTQAVNIAKQLELGTRYFDIRPVITGGRFACGHYNKDCGLCVGGNGQFLDDIIDQVNNFCRGKRELVILNISHDVNTDVGFGCYRNFTETEWNRLFYSLLKINNLCTCNKDLCNKEGQGKTIEELTVNGSTVVVRLASESAVHVARRLPQDLSQKFCMQDDFAIYDDYTGTTEFGEMCKDQFQKMQEQASKMGSLFLLSWTLTQGIQEAVNSIISSDMSILSFAETANMHLDGYLFNEMNSKHIYPNIVYIDKIDSPNAFFAVQEANDMRR